MKKIIIGIIAVIVLGGGGWIIANINSAPKEVPQTAGTTPAAKPSSSPTASQAALRGSFTEIDAVHKGSGQAVLAGGQLKLENFSVTQGPDLYVYLGKTSDGKSLEGAVSLGKLQSNKGDQSYTLPENYRDFKSVVIYCRAFKVNFSIASLSPAT